MLKQIMGFHISHMLLQIHSKLGKNTIGFFSLLLRVRDIHPSFIIYSLINAFFSHILIERFHYSTFTLVLPIIVTFIYISKWNSIHYEHYNTFERVWLVKLFEKNKKSRSMTIILVKN